MILTQCAACAKPLAHDAPRCVRCWTRYCDASCQLEHWSKGHKKQCKKIARGGGAEQFYADAKAKEAAEAAVVECRPNIPADAICYICRDDGSRQGLVSGCGCHGGVGIAHVSCLVRMAQAAAEDWEEGLGSLHIQKWFTCFECDQQFRGAVQLALGWACWKTYLGRPEANRYRCDAMRLLGQGLDTDETTRREAGMVLEAHLEVLRRVFPGDYREILASQTAIALNYKRAGNHDGALALQRDIYREFTTRVGPDHKCTLCSAINLAMTMVLKRNYDDAERMIREKLPAAIRSLGPDHSTTLVMKHVLSALLMNFVIESRDTLSKAQVRSTLHEAETIARDTIPRLRRVVGALHPDTIQLEGVLRSLTRMRATLVEGTI